MPALPYLPRLRPAALPRVRAVMLPDGKFHRPFSGVDFLLFAVVPIAHGPIPPVHQPL